MSPWKAVLAPVFAPLLFAPKTITYHRKESQTSFSAIGISRNVRLSLIGPESSDRIDGPSVTYEYFEALKVTPPIARLFTDENDHPGAEPTTLIWERLWKTHFWAKDSIIGESISLTGQIYTGIGVLPTIYPIESRNVWTPLGPIEDKGVFPERENHPDLKVIATIKPGIGLDQARSDLEHIDAELANEYPVINEGITVTIKSMS